MSLLSKQISTKTLVPVCRQLATSYDAGIPIVQTLAMAAGSERNPRMRQVLQDMEYDIRGGASLAEAATKQQEFLPPLLISLLGSGEAGGRLDVILRDAAGYFEDRLAMQRSVVSALWLPVIQLVLSWFLGTFALGLVRHLDFSGSSVFNFRTYLIHYAMFQATALLVMASVAAVSIAGARLGWFGGLWSWMGANTWPFRFIVRRFALARFFRSFALLIASGLPVHRCIERAAAAAGNPYIERELLRAVPPVLEGESLVTAFTRADCLSASAREMLNVAEQSGKLDTTLRKMSEYYVNEATHALELAARTGRVLITLLVGVVVGYIVISFYSRLYGGLSNIH